MADESGLSDQALALLQAHLAAIGLRNGGTSGEPTEQTREAYRELARAGLMGACHTFVGGRESLYRLTEEAFNRRAELIKLEPTSHRWRFSPSEPQSVRRKCENHPPTPDSNRSRFAGPGFEPRHPSV